LEDPPPELRVFMRLLNCKDKDAFLLEALFRTEAWGLICDPVSKENEVGLGKQFLSHMSEDVIQRRGRGSDTRLRTWQE